MTGAGGELLGPLQAALHLKITPELLFGYTRATFRKSANDARRLQTVQRAGKTLFSVQELDDFDAYLREPWAPAGASRTDPPKCIVDHLRAESGNQCARCGSGVGVQTAHIDPWTTSRSHHPLNLIRLCSGCHLEHDLHKSIPTEELRSLKDGLTARMRSFTFRRLEPIPPRFRPPPPTGKFVGYTDALAGLKRGLQAGRSVFVLGVAGVGKTQLALRALQDMETGRPVVWIPVESYGSPANVLAALKMAVTDGLTSHDPDWIVARLDELQACVVFDGIERVGAASADEFGDLLAGLVERTTRAQFLFTSQLMLQSVPADGTVRLGQLDPDSSRQLLGRSIVEVREIDPSAEIELLEFCEGHPLTIRLVGALVDFFGSGATALRRIREQGSQSIRLQKRSSHGSQTSLECSLSLAYDSLEYAEKKLLWLVANAPAGLLSAQVEVGDSFGLQDPALAIAGLRRWSLIRSIRPGERNERLYALSPVRSFVARRWQEENPEEAETSLRQLLVEFAFMAGDLDRHASGNDGIVQMVERYREELPNLLRVLEAVRPSDDEFALLTYALCGSLMRYFFLLGFSEKGTEIMRKAVDVAMQRGEHVHAADFAVRLLTLARRSDDRRSIDAAVKLLDTVEGRVAGEESAAVANLSLARAMIALDSERWSDAERFAERAARWYEPLVRDRTDESTANDLSGALAILGDALAAQHKYADAETAYRRALELGSASYLAVNRGQLLHQLGNVAGYRCDWPSAAECYVQAAQHFHEVGMQDYLANALGELGYVAIELEGIRIPGSVLSDGLVDVCNAVIRTFGGDRSTNPTDRRITLRKLIGTVSLASFMREDSALEGFSAGVRRALARNMKTSGMKSDGHEISLVETVLMVAEAVEAMARLSDRAGEEGRAVIERMATGVYILDDLGRSFGTLRWFVQYLRRCCGRPGVTEYDVISAFDEAEQTGVFTLD